MANYENIIIDFIDDTYQVPDDNNIIFEFGVTVGTTLYNILAGNSNIFIAISADNDAGINNGKFYVASYGVGASFTIIDLENKVVLDSYTTTVKGRTNEKLEQEDIIDLNIGDIN